MKKTLYLWDLGGTLFNEQWDPQLTGFATYDDYAKSIGIVPTDYRKYEEGFRKFFEHGETLHLSLIKGFKETLGWTKHNETFTRGNHEQLKWRANYLNPKVGFDITKFFQKVVSTFDYNNTNIKTKEVIIKYLQERFAEGYDTIVYTDDSFENCKLYLEAAKKIKGLQYRIYNMKNDGLGLRSEDWYYQIGNLSDLLANEKSIKSGLPFNPQGNIFHWGPVPGKFFYCSAFTAVHYKYFRAKYKENWSETLWLFNKDNRMFWINDLDNIQAAGLRVFLKYLLPIKSRKKIATEWRGHVKELLKIHKRLEKIKLAELTDKQLQKLWDDYHKVYIKFWVTGSVPELANYGSEKYLHNKLSLSIKSEAELNSVMEILTAPTRLSFYQEEELDLFKTKDLKKHQQKYFWLKNSYNGTEVLPVEFFKERKVKLNKKLSEEIRKKMAEILAKKKFVQKKYSLSKEIMVIAKAISDGVGWQDERKKYIFMVLHYEDVMLCEVSRRSNYTINELHWAWYHEIAEIIGHKNLHKKLTKRKNGFGVRFFHTCKELNAQQMNEFWDLYDSKVEVGVVEVKGIVASKGKISKVKGRVHIILDPAKAAVFQEGEILVAPMTSPEYVFLMKKSLAVITDTGGLTSHAAIVSRELNIPCIVGTKNATKIFKDGDVVEIDVGAGTIRKL